MVTMQMTVEGNGGRLTKDGCRNILDRGWKGTIADSVRTIKGFKSGNGAAFDLSEDMVDRFLDTF